MGDYLAMRILEKAYTYDYVVSNRPDLKASVDEALTRQGHSELITTS